MTAGGSADSTSFYGAFDMNGNVWEWNETLIGSSRGMRGGSYSSSGGGLRSSGQSNFNASSASRGIGFRLASPECVADFNDDGKVDAMDVLDSVTAVGDGDPAASFDGSATVDFFDVVAFLTHVDAGCS